jgi:hypothetical protein
MVNGLYELTQLQWGMCLAYNYNLDLVLQWLKLV